MLEYERDKIKELEDVRSKLELECGKLESENKVLGLKIERTNEEHFEKIHEKEDEMEFVKEQAKKHVLFIIKQQKEQQ